MLSFLFKTKMVEEEGKEPIVHFHINQAVLCRDCRTVSNAIYACPACTSRSIDALSNSNIMNYQPIENKHVA